MAPTPPQFPAPGSFKAKLTLAMIGVHTRLYRLSGGRIGGKLAGGQILLVDHVGRKSGTERTTPLLFVPDGDNRILIASRGGSDATPAWWINLKANPATTIQVGSERIEVQARQATAEEKPRLWGLATAVYPDYDLYQSRTEREIPVVVLEPR